MFGRDRCYFGTVRGVVTPVDWDEALRIRKLAICTDDDARYDVDGVAPQVDLYRCLRAEVVAEGLITTAGDGRCGIGVQRCRLVFEEPAAA